MKLSGSESELIVNSLENGICEPSSNSSWDSLCLLSTNGLGKGMDHNISEFKSLETASGNNSAIFPHQKK